VNRCVPGRTRNPPNVDLRLKADHYTLLTDAFAATALPETTVQAWRAGSWRVTGLARYRVNGNGLELSVSRALVGQSGGLPAFDFHLADNIQGFDGARQARVIGLLRLRAKTVLPCGARFR
jgi:hypothetical protein